MRPPQVCGQAVFLRRIERLFAVRLRGAFAATAAKPVLAERMLRLIAELIPELAAIVRALRRRLLLRRGRLPELRHKAKIPPIIAPIPTVMTPQKAGSDFAASRIDS